MTTRIYIVHDIKSKVNRLIRAQTPAQARSYCASTQYRCEVATQDTLVDLVKQGVEVETAGQREDQGELPLEKAA